MALSIQHPEVDQLARALASETGLSLTDAVIRALREQLERERHRLPLSDLANDLRAIGDRCARMPDIDRRSADEILGFDEHGLPS